MAMPPPGNPDRDPSPPPANSGCMPKMLPGQAPRPMGPVGPTGHMGPMPWTPFSELLFPGTVPTMVPAQSRQFLALVARLTARSRRSRPIRCPWPHGHRPADNAHAPNAAYGARAHAHTGAADAVPGLPGLPGPRPRPRPTKVPACATAAATAGAEAEAAGLHTAECCAAGGGHPSATEGNGRG